MRKSIVIPNYNGRNLLEKNLPKVLEIPDIAEIVIVDDASLDDSVANIKYQISNLKNNKVKIIENKTNLGFSSTVNRGVKEATGELVILLNTDVCPEKSFLNSVLPHFNNPEVFAVGCMQKCPEKTGVILRGRGIGKFRKGFLSHSRGDVDKNDTLWVSGGAGIFRKSIWDKLGGLCQLYDPFYWEDIDLSYRALKAGYKTMFEPKSVVVHAQSEGAIRSKYSPADIKTISYRNQILFVWLNITDWKYVINHCLYMPVHLIRSAFLTGDSAFIKGFFMALRILPKITISRTRNRKAALLSDSKII